MRFSLIGYTTDEDKMEIAQFHYYQDALALARIYASSSAAHDFNQLRIFNIETNLCVDSLEIK